MSNTSKDDPAVRRASAFEALRVRDAMHQPARTCGPEASLVSVAHTLAAHHIHAVVVEGLGEDAGDRPWGIVSALDVSHAAAHPWDHRTAADTAATEVMMVSPDESLPRAAQIMAEHELTHLVVVESPDERPWGSCRPSTSPGPTRTPSIQRRARRRSRCSAPVARRDAGHRATRADAR